MPKYKDDDAVERLVNELVMLASQGRGIEALDELLTKYVMTQSQLTIQEEP